MFTFVVSMSGQVVVHHREIVRDDQGVFGIIEVSPAIGKIYLWSGCLLLDNVGRLCFRAVHYRQTGEFGAVAPPL